MVNSNSYLEKRTLDKRDILYSLLPTYFSNNWYMTSYILFCFVYPVLNLSIKHLDQRKHLIVAAVLFIAYYVLNFIYLFPWASTCALWVTIYYVMAYFKLYGQKVCQSKTINILLMLMAIVLHFGLLFLSNFIYLKTGRVGIMRWNDNGNVLFLIISFSCLNLMRMTKFNNKAINYLSSLSMFMYIIHENLLFRKYIRTIIWEWIYKNLGYNLVLVWILVFAVALFIASLIASILYDISLKKLVHLISDKMLELIKRITFKITDRFIKNS